MSALLAFWVGVLGFLGSIGPMELLVIAGLGVLIFGHRLPKVARSLGKGITEFKKGLKDVRKQTDVAGEIEAADADRENADEADEDEPRKAPRTRRRRRVRRDAED